MTEKKIRTALVTGADRGLGYEMVLELLRQGFRVYAGKYNLEYSLLDDLKAEWSEIRVIKLDVSSYNDIVSAEKTIREDSGYLDLIVSNAAYMSGPKNDIIGGDAPLDTDMLKFAFRTNSAPAPLLVDVLLPLMLVSDYRRLFFTSSEISSMRLSQRRESFRYAMTKSALNVSVRMMFNKLRPMGFRFRLYHPGWLKHMNPDRSLSEGIAPLDPADSAKAAVSMIMQDRPDEDRLVLIDLYGQELSF